MKINVRSFWLGSIALIGATVLFCLPGSEFPEEDWFAKIFLDKWVHIGLFAVLVSLWCLPLFYRIESRSRLFNFFIWISIAFVVYGIVIEFIQGNFIPNRTFGIDDIVADAIGCGVGFMFVNNQLKRKFQR